MVSIRIYVEGGGDGKTLRTACRRGFAELLKKAGLAGRMPRIIACGGRQNAFDSFRTALNQDIDGDCPLLLVDAEVPVAGADPWQHLHRRDGWNRPTGAADCQCHLMVQLMESWFLAIRTTLAGYFGTGFRQAALPGQARMEDIPKPDVLNGLKAATRGTQKGEYSKGKHSFAILALIDPGRVEDTAPWAARFFQTLQEEARP